MLHRLAVVLLFLKTYPRALIVNHQSVIILGKNIADVGRREPTMRPSLINNAGLHQMETFVFNNKNQNQLKVSVNYLNLILIAKKRISRE